MFVRTAMENLSYQCISTRFGKATSKLLSEAESKLLMFILNRILSELRATGRLNRFWLQLVKKAPDTIAGGLLRFVDAMLILLEDVGFTFGECSAAIAASLL